MDFMTAQAIRDTLGSLRGALPDETYKKVAPMLSDLVALLERAHEEERRQLREERAALDKEREAANFARHSLTKEREALAIERENIEREKRVAQLWRQTAEGLGELSAALDRDEPPPRDG